MSNLKICPCGIAADDCDYHKPAESDQQWTLLPSAYPGHEWPTVRFRMADGTWYSAISFKDDKLDDLNRIAKQIGDYHQLQVRKALDGIFKDNEPI